MDTTTNIIVIANIIILAINCVYLKNNSKSL